jgi:putative protein-disulfide isomerase
MITFNRESASPEMHSGQAINIVYYTDPLCCWSWGMEQQLARLEKESPAYINWRYCMGGLLPGWSLFADNQNNILRPAQLGPLWMHAGETLGLTIAHRIWVEDPPATSYPACIAVKCAALQSAKAGKLYLHYVRKAVMVHGLNIAKQDELLEVAKKTAVLFPGFSLRRFEEDMKSGEGIEAFRKDLQEVKYRNINRFPTLLIQRDGAPGLLVTGYRPAEVLINIINEYKRNEAYDADNIN